MAIFRGPNGSWRRSDRSGHGRVGFCRLHHHRREARRQTGPDKLKPGVTTIADVKAAFGPPFQETKEPDGTDQLQYISKVRMRDDSGNTGPTVGSNIPRQIVKNVSSMLVFDQRGHFLHAWTADKTVDKNVPGNLGKTQAGDVTRGSLAGHGVL